MSKDEIIKSLEKMTLIELNDLVKAIEEHFGVVAAIAAAPSESDSVSKEPTEADVLLKELGTASKVQIIKALAKLTGKGLMDCKKLIDKLPVVLKEKAKMEEAEEIKKQFQDLGAIIELK